MKRIVWTFGLISGAILSAMMLLVMPFWSSIGYNKAEIIGYTTMIAAFLLIFFGIRSYRENVGRGFVSFGRAVAVGALISAVASACYVATWEVIYYKIAPDFGSKFSASRIEKVQRSDASEAEKQEKIAELQRFAQMYQNPFFNAAITFLEPLPVAFVITLVSAAVLRRRRDEATSGALEPSRAV